MAYRTGQDEPPQGRYVERQQPTSRASSPDHSYDTKQELANTQWRIRGSPTVESAVVVVAAFGTFGILSFGSGDDPLTKEREWDVWRAAASVGVAIAALLLYRGFKALKHPTGPIATLELDTRRWCLGFAAILYCLVFGFLYFGLASEPPDWPMPAMDWRTGFVALTVGLAGIPWVALILAAQRVLRAQRDEFDSYHSDNAERGSEEPSDHDPHDAGEVSAVPAARPAGPDRLPKPMTPPRSDRPTPTDPPRKSAQERFSRWTTSLRESLGRGPTRGPRGLHEHLQLWDMLLASMVSFGLLVAVAIFPTGALRSLWLAYANLKAVTEGEEAANAAEAGGGTPQEIDEAKDLAVSDEVDRIGAQFSTLDVLLYGAFFAVILAALTVPVLAQWRATSRLYVDKEYALRKLSDVTEVRINDRGRLEKLLHIDSGLLRNPLTVFSVLTPLITAVLAAFVPELAA